MTVFTVDSNELSNTSVLVNNCADNIRSQVQTMLSYLHQLENSWSGQASMQFHDLADNWHKAQINVEDCLLQISHQLNNAANTYSQAEQEATALFNF
ncbi:WXG100 family type VII secretion target [Actinomyces sp. zg-332]|uniref:WXG100 family type VII secretion target n=1 Tax=Actinomyces sp. zg-332 TaxID=2708340 RepID=UPI00141DF5E7|nr:WXG100 family type VII secretion target [Actinomyces sp. zg-332]QPK94322.1 WXG100 family type VII secretion target [Actinomyces sp. zg-332]